jgi:hypothetical protein
MKRYSIAAKAKTLRLPHGEAGEARRGPARRAYSVAMLAVLLGTVARRPTPRLGTPARDGRSPPKLASCKYLVPIARQN